MSLMPGVNRSLTVLEKEESGGTGAAGATLMGDAEGPLGPSPLISGAMAAALFRFLAIFGFCVSIRIDVIADLNIGSPTILESNPTLSKAVCAQFEDETSTDRGSKVEAA